LYVHLLRIQKLAVWERPGSGTPILFTHATGFHARVWDSIIKELPDRHCFAIDLRGHGRSDKDFESYSWRRFGEDTALIAKELGLRGAIGVGHSLGGHAMALAASIEPAAFSRLLLVDPVIHSADWYDGAPHMVEFIARRKKHWKSAQEMFERFHARLPFSAWKPQILRDYCQFGLLPEHGLLPEQVGFVLACPPEIEASIYAHSNWPDADISEEVAKIQVFTTVLRSAKLMTKEHFDLSASATDPKLASRMANAEDVFLEGASHFIPMEHPELIVKALR
jgi:lipase